MKRVTVFCGSSSGNDVIYEKQATLLGSELAKQEIELVYGGAKVGLMGAVANGVLNNGGKVTGILPRFLMNKEIAHESLTELIIVETMHERKTRMSELCDGVIALPGGFGTLEELFEILTWAQLGLHQKPVAILNVDGFYDSLLTCVQTMVTKGFLKEVNQKVLLVSDDIGSLIKQMNSYKAPVIRKWISKETT